MKLTARNTHRDIAYFYLGLIIAFSFSGIFLNHRRLWHPSKYTYNTKEIVTKLPDNQELINEEFISSFTSENEINDQLRRFQVTESELIISYVNNDVSINLSSGAGKITTYKTTPILGQMTKLHVDTSQWWIYYSDLFGVAMLTIAITGMFIQTGDKSFQKRGWKLALAGIIFPLIFLFLLS